MPDLTYWRIIETTDEDFAPNLDMKPELTMLATGDLLDDIKTMLEQAQAGPWKHPGIQLLQSSSYGEESTEDGKDKYRQHSLVMSLAVHGPEILREYP